MPTIARSHKSVDTSLETRIWTNHNSSRSFRTKGWLRHPAPKSLDESPADVEPDEVLPDTDKRPTATFLEEPKRGRQCCVFLINGQRQHAWDNQFVVRDLELKYLRNRMIVVVDCDGLKPEAIAHLMQGSRNQFRGHGLFCPRITRVRNAQR